MLSIVAEVDDEPQTRLVQYGQSHPNRVARWQLQSLWSNSAVISNATNYLDLRGQTVLQQVVYIHGNTSARVAKSRKQTG